MTIAKQTAEAYFARLEARDWTRFAHLLATDVVYDMPQTRERVTGREEYVRFNQEYPGVWHLAVRQLLADEQRAAVWVDARVGDERMHAIVWLDINEDGKVVRVTDFWPETYEPPPNREHLTQRY